MKNGLYSIHVTLQDGRSGKGSGVIVFRDGKILGGDAYLFYIGSYTSKPRWWARPARSSRRRCASSPSSIECGLE